MAIRADSLCAVPAGGTNLPSPFRFPQVDLVPMGLHGFDPMVMWEHRRPPESQHGGTLEKMESSVFGSQASDSWIMIEDPEQARMLSDPVTLRYLRPFIARERTATQAAMEADCSLEAMLYRVRTFLRAGLLQVVREEPRAGRAIKMYRSTADSFFVPFGVTPYAGLEERLEAQLSEFQALAVRNMARILREMGIEGRRIYRDGHGEVREEASSGPNEAFEMMDASGPAVLDFSVRANLTHEEAKGLQAELLSLWRRYEDMDRPGRPYLIQALLVPDKDGS